MFPELFTESADAREPILSLHHPTAESKTIPEFSVTCRRITVNSNRQFFSVFQLQEIAFASGGMQFLLVEMPFTHRYDRRDSRQVKTAISSLFDLRKPISAERESRYTRASIFK
ncbi:MAG TPA: hypothetical protein VJ603_06180 [Paucimonas sp.]|nr:hypothetical protein [Paucimonas sp.]